MSTLPQNGIEMTSRNFAVCYLWNQTSLKMPKRNVSEKSLNALPKNTEQMPKRAPKSLPLCDQTLVFASPNVPPHQVKHPLTERYPKKIQNTRFSQEEEEEERRKRKWGRGKEEEEGRKTAEGRGRKEGRKRKRKQGRNNKEEGRRIPKPITFPNQHIFAEHASSYIIIEIGKQIQRMNYY